ncbi:nSTAND1 domain-containing NTPase [Nonomuraea candida]|uniref:nSTAND1 domain-containing NTPase n=1 Tax=Nonomuraea candida TaxID=359159 RepID=UPI0005B9E33A|nr:ATP-binding protein [Nonomuraea candida]
MALAYVRTCGGDVAVWEARWRAAVAEWDAHAAAGRSPYLGLAAYGPNDADRFFGRDRLITALVERVARQRLVAVVGASGSGKSSLLRAGLIPALAAGGDFSLRFTPGAHPLRECAVRLGAELRVAPGELVTDFAAREGSLGLALRQVLLTRPAGTEGVPIVDQFEEVFTLCADEDERETFIAALLAAAHDSGYPVRVVLGLRADFYAHCARPPALVDALQDAQVLVGPMTAGELAEVVTESAARAWLGAEGTGPPPAPPASHRPHTRAPRDRPSAAHRKQQDPPWCGM